MSLNIMVSHFPLLTRWRFHGWPAISQEILWYLVRSYMGTTKRKGTHMWVFSSDQSMTLICGLICVPSYPWAMRRRTGSTRVFIHLSIYLVLGLLVIQIKYPMLKPQRGFCIVSTTTWSAPARMIIISCRDHMYAIRSLFVLLCVGTINGLSAFT